MQSSESDYPWPEPGDSLFGDRGWHVACLGWSSDQWYGFIEGYRRAFEILLQHVLDGGREQDKLVYPIVFVSRHYLEVRLKHLLLSASRLLDRDYSLSTRHDLMKTWQPLRILIEEIFEGQDQGELDAVEGVLKEFDAKDSSSMVFRYPIDTKGQPHHDSKWSLALPTFGQTMEKIASFLDCCAMAIEQYEEAQHDMLLSSM